MGRRAVPGTSGTLTHCPYCALNCGLELRTTGTTVVGQARWKGSPLTGGAVCSKGVTAWKQVHHPDRLTTPLVRDRPGLPLREATWEEALDRAADGFLRLRAQHGPAANAVVGGGSLTNEKAYLLGKLARVGFETPHIDLNGRMCMTSAGAAYALAFGLDRAMTPFEDVARADVVVVVGANLSSSFPVRLPGLLADCRKRGGRVVVVDPRSSRFVDPGDLHLQLRPGTDAVVAGGLLRELVRQGRVDERFVADRTVGFADAVAAADRWDPATVEHVAGVPAHLLVEAARVIGTADRGMYLHARGAEQHVTGTRNVLALINVALARGHAGRPGCGVDMLTGQRNGQGGREMGQRADQLPGYRSIADPEHRRVVAERWGIDEAVLPTAPGLTYVEILEAAHRRQVRGLLAISTNPAVSAPDLGWAGEALDRLDHLVLIDPFLSETARHATVVLPGTTFAEEDGTITTIEGRVVRVDQAVPPVPVRGDLDVLRNLATRLGVGRHFRFASGRQVFEEVRAVSAGAPADYSGMTWDGLRRRGGIFWPCPEPGHPGTPRLHLDRFAHADGRARFHPVRWEAPPGDHDPARPLVLTTGRVLAHYLSGNQTRRIPEQLAKAPEPVAEIHPATAASVGLVEGRPVRLTSAQGSVTVAWRPSTDLRPDTIYLPYHWPVANRLTGRALDPTSRIPGFKHTPVQAHPAEPESDLKQRDSVVEGLDAARL